MSIKRVERMTESQIRASKELLGTVNITGRHVNTICKRGGIRFFGQVIDQDGKFHLETKPLPIVRERMIKEGFVAKSKVTGNCVWTT